MSRSLAIFLYVLLCLLVVSLVFNLSASNPVYESVQREEGFSYEFVHAEVSDVNPVKVRIEGEEVDAPVSRLNISDEYLVGDEVLVYMGTDDESGEIFYETVDYYHAKGLLWVFVIFAVLCIFIARAKGITAIISVMISLSLFYYLFLKMITSGYSPLFSCLTFTLIITFLTIPLIHGFNKKSLSALCAIAFGYILSLCICYLFKDLVQLGKYPNEDFKMLGVMFPNIALSEILICSLFIGAIGALIDTAVSISSAIFEAVDRRTRRGFIEIYKIGMEVGKDILGSMINTLLFAYLASALPFLILLLLDANSSMNEFINMDYIALELSRTFIGAVSLLILIPITASISAYFFAKSFTST